MQLIALQPSNGAAQFRSVMPLVAPDAARIWAHVAYTGEWLGYHEGPVVITTQHMDEMVANLERQVNPKPLYTEHERGLAWGWVHKLERRGEQLYALFELTDEARDWIAKGQYKFTSISFDLESVDRETGKDAGAEIREISLTNDPFLDGQEPLQLSRQTPKRRLNRSDSMPAKTTPKPSKATFANAKEAAQKALELLEDKATKEDVIAAFEAQMQLDEATEGGGSGGGSSPEGEASKVEASAAPEGGGEFQEVPEDEQLAIGAELLSMLQGALEGMGPEEILAALRENIAEIADAIRSGAQGDGTPADEGAASAAPATTGAGSMSRADRIELNRLRAKNEEHEKQIKELSAAREREEDAKIEARMDELRLPEAEREDARFMFKHHPERAERLYSTGRFSVPGGSFAPSSKDSDAPADPEKVTFADLDPERQKRATNLMSANPRAYKTRDDAAKGVARADRQRAQAGVN